MKVLRKIIQGIIKARPIAVNMMFSEKVIIYQWILFGKFKIFKTFKSL